MNPENRVEFTKDMKDYTLLAPNMADVHFSILLIEKIIIICYIIYNIFCVCCDI